MQTVDNKVLTNGVNGHAELNQNEAIYSAGLVKSRPRGTRPYHVGDPQVQANRVLRILRTRKTDLERYEVLNHLRTNNAALFYQILIDNLTYCVPLVYTPVIGEACLKGHEIYSGTERGLWLTMHDRNHFDEILADFPQREVEIAVMTDGSRILGLGDLGSNGFAISQGKLSLYIACAGVDPSRTLPIHLDCGTNNEALRNDASYMGLRHHRISDDQLLPIVQDFLDAFHRRWPKAIMQFEDFRTEAAFAILEAQQDQRACFNDDIQGTAAVSLAGFINALRLSGKPDIQHRFVFFGAGSAAVGIGHLMCEYFVLKGIKEEQARKMFYFVDSKGLVTHSRGDKLPQHKVYFARSEPEVPQLKHLIDVINFVKPTGLLGLSTIGGSFDLAVLEKMAELNERPIIFPLSNPSSKAECSFERAMKATNGKCLFGSGSPFPPVIWQGKTRVGGQANNMYCFPSIGLASILAGVKRIPNAMIHGSAQALANSLSPQEKADELLFPMITRIREICVPMTRDLIRVAQAEGVDTNLRLREMSDSALEKYIASRMWSPEVATSNHL